MDSLLYSIHYVSLLIYVISLIAMILFWNKVKHERYWIGFPISIAFFSLHEFFEILNDDIAGYATLFGIETDIFAEISEIIGAIILILSLYYLIRELKKISDIESKEMNEPD